MLSAVTCALRFVGAPMRGRSQSPQLQHEPPRIKNPPTSSIGPFRFRARVLASDGIYFEGEAMSPVIIEKVSEACDREKRAGEVSECGEPSVTAVRYIQDNEEMKVYKILPRGGRVLVSW
jgi:uncharacterized protein (DUF3084 family)